MNARPESVLGTPDLAHLVSKHSLERRHVLRCAVRERTIGPVPNIFRGVKLRGICREELIMKSPMLTNEACNFCTAMDCSSVPQQDHMPPEVRKETSEETPDIQACEISRAESDIQRYPSFPGGHSNGADGGYPVLPVVMVQEGGMPSRRPCSSNVWDEHEPGFIKKYKVGTKPCGLFLYSETGTSANAHWRPRPVPMPAAPVSGSSTPDLTEPSIHGWGDIGRRTVFRSLRPSVVMSIHPSDTRQPKALSKALSPALSSLPWKAWVVDLAWGADAIPALLPSGTSDTTETRNSRKSLPLVLLPTDSSPLLATGLPVGAASPIAVQFHWVSCPRVYRNTMKYSIIYANINKTLPSMEFPHFFDE